jgi:hypothetical protein
LNSENLRRPIAANVSEDELSVEQARAFRDDSDCEAIVEQIAIQQHDLDRGSNQAEAQQPCGQQGSGRVAKRAVTTTFRP